MRRFPSSSQGNDRNERKSISRGLMIAQGLATNGAKVYIAGRREETLEKAKSSTTGIKGEIIV